VTPPPGRSTWTWLRSASTLRPAVVLAHQRDDPVGELGEQVAALERPKRGIDARGPSRPGVAHFAALGIRPPTLLLVVPGRKPSRGSRPNLGDSSPSVSAHSASRVFMTC
jgi:hypothetical protein